MKEVELDVRVSSLPVPEYESEDTPAAASGAGETPKEIEGKKNKNSVEKHIESLDRQLRMIEGLTPMRKSIEQKGSIEVAKLNTDAAIRKQSAYQRYIGYAEDRRSGQKKIARKEFYPSVVATFVEHLTADEKCAFLSHLV